MLSSCATWSSLLLPEDLDKPGMGRGWSLAAVDCEEKGAKKRWEKASYQASRKEFMSRKNQGEPGNIN